MRSIIIVACVIAILGISPSHADEPISSLVPQPEIVGEGRLRVFMWDVYDATLISSNGKWQSDKPFALQLSYLREIEGKKIAERTAEEIRNQGLTDEVKIADWHTQMRKIFPTVRKGTVLTGVYTNSDETIFYRDNVEIGRIKDPEFGKAFFNIWLGETTSSPDLRKKLLGKV